MGLPYLSLMDVLEKASEKPDVLKLGFVHPDSPSNSLNHL